MSKENRINIPVVIAGAIALAVLLALDGPVRKGKIPFLRPFSDASPLTKKSDVVSPQQPGQGVEEKKSAVGKTATQGEELPGSMHKFTYGTGTNDFFYVNLNTIPDQRVGADFSVDLTTSRRILYLEIIGKDETIREKPVYSLKITGEHPY